MKDKTSRGEADAGEIEPTLGISKDKVCYFIAKARAFDAGIESEDSDADAQSHIIEDVDDLEDDSEESSNDPAFIEMKGFIEDLNDDEQIALVSLAWVGRGTYSIGEWEEALSEAERAHNQHTAEYLLGIPLLADYLEEGLSVHGMGCDDI